MSKLSPPDWVITAENALAAAKALPPGAERQDALREAGALRYAAHLREARWDAKIPRKVCTSDNNRLERCGLLLKSVPLRTADSASDASLNLLRGKFIPRPK